MQALEYAKLCVAESAPEGARAVTSLHFRVFSRLAGEHEASILELTEPDGTRASVAYSLTQMHEGVAYTEWYGVDDEGVAILLLS